MNPVLLTKQLKENANDLQDFRKDLQSWGDEMKRKEQSIREDSSKKVRIQVPAKSKATPQAQAVLKTRTIDYSKWDKFDADLECERLEDDYKDDSELSDEFENSARDEAIVHKEKGNSYVKAKEWDKAIDCYTKAINCYSYDPIFYANRALCYLKKNSFIAAEEDCTLSLRLDTTYVKALQRRAAARESLGQLQFAASDLELVLSHEPKNKESIFALERIRKKLGYKEKSIEEDPRPISKFTASRNKTQSTKPIITKSTIKTDKDAANSKMRASALDTSDWTFPGCEIIHVKAINKPPHLRSGKPLKRIEVVEINKSHSVAEKMDHSPNAFKNNVIEHVQPDLAAAGDRSKIASPFRSIVKNPEQPRHGKNTSDSSEQNTEENFVQFYSAWQNANTLDKKYKYLKLIGSQKLRTIFGESLMETYFFSDILEVLSTNFIQNEDEDIYDFLIALTQVNRFPLLALFKGSVDEACLWKLVAYLREKGRNTKDEIDHLISDYALD